jgi:hypothetical protein
MLLREEKETRFGLRDLWDPVKRADLCCSCHIGDASQGKVVTHEMYAAGHPPLPGFEIVSFSDAMPRHWETLQEKYKRLPKYRDTYNRVYHFGAHPELDQVRLLLISAVIAFRNSVKLIEDHAVAAKAPAGVLPERVWPEFALYDCYACHHDLKDEAWRQQRGFAPGTKPGRPQMRDWSLALIPLTLDAIQPPKLGEAKLRADYDVKLLALRKSFSSTPFGPPAEVADHAHALVQWSDSMLKELQILEVNPASSALLLKEFANRPGKDLDFDSARQVAWSLRALFATLHPKALEGLEAKDGPFDKLASQLNLNLPEKQQLIAGTFMAKTMEKQARYNPDEFRMAVEAIANSLKNGKAP